MHMEGTFLYTFYAIENIAATATLTHQWGLRASNLSVAESKPATCLLAFNKSRMPPAPPFTPWAASASSSVV